MPVLLSDAPKRMLQATETSLHVGLVNIIHLAAGSFSLALASSWIKHGSNAESRGFQHRDVQQSAAAVLQTMRSLETRLASYCKKKLPI